MDPLVRRSVCVFKRQPLGRGSPVSSLATAGQSQVSRCPSGRWRRARGDAGAVRPAGGRGHREMWAMAGRWRRARGDAADVRPAGGRGHGEMWAMAGRWRRAREDAAGTCLPVSICIHLPRDWSLGSEVHVALEIL